jgi:multiple sugar transport system substrate-binding protein
MPRLAASGELLPVPDQYTSGGAYAWKGLLPLFNEKLLTWDQKAYALPILGDALVCYYREDLLQDAGHREAFKGKFGRDLAPPRTWEEFADLAEFFHGRDWTGGKTPAFSLPPLPKDDDGLDREFFAVAACFARRAVREDEKSSPGTELFSFHYELDTGIPRINKPGFVHALQLLRRMQAFRPQEAAAEPTAAFESGRAVLCVAGPAWAARFQKSPHVAKRFGVCRAPGGGCFFAFESGDRVPAADNFVPYLGTGGWLGVVPKGATHPEAAFALLAFLGDPKIGLEIVTEPEWGGGAFRRDQLVSGGWQSFGLREGVKNSLVEAIRQWLLHPQMINPVVRLRTPDAAAHQMALLAQVRAALTGGMDAQAALDAAAAEWRRLDQGTPLKARVSNYRLSLGLIPLP